MSVANPVEIDSTISRLTSFWGGERAQHGGSPTTTARRATTLPSKGSRRNNRWLAGEQDEGFDGSVIAWTSHLSWTSSEYARRVTRGTSRAARRARSKQFHPDRAPPGEASAFLERMKRVNA